MTAEGFLLVHEGYCCDLTLEKQHKEQNCSCYIYMFPTVLLQFGCSHTFGELLLLWVS